MLAATDRGETGGVLAGFGDDDAAYLVVDEQRRCRGGLGQRRRRGGSRRAGAGPRVGHPSGRVLAVRRCPVPGAGRGGRGTRRCAHGRRRRHASTTSRRPPTRCGTPSSSSCRSSPSPSPRSCGWWWAGRCVLSRRSAPRSRASAVRASTAEFPVPPGDDEVARLARTMNGMLERIEAAADRQRRFVADAAHELRTPTDAHADRARGRPRPPLRRRSGGHRGQRAGRGRGPPAPRRRPARPGPHRRPAPPSQRSQSRSTSWWPRSSTPPGPAPPIAIETMLDPVTVHGDAEALRRARRQSPRQRRPSRIRTRRPHPPSDERVRRAGGH